MVLKWDILYILSVKNELDINVTIFKMNYVKYPEWYHILWNLWMFYISCALCLGS